MPLSSEPQSSLERPAGNQLGAEATTTPVPAPRLSQSQIAMVTELANTAEIEQGKLAQAKAKSAAVKKFAAMMQKDHTATTTELKGILSKSSLGITPPADLDERRKGMLDNLRSAAIGRRG